MIKREIVEGKQVQGIDESIAYTVTTTPWGSSPVSVSVKAYDITGPAYTDVSSTVLSGAASVSGDVITTPVLTALTEDHRYRVEVKFTCSGNTYEAYFFVDAEK